MSGTGKITEIEFSTNCRPRKKLGVGHAGAGIQKQWNLKAGMPSPPYTTDWTRLFVVS
ncbi:DUF4113 domain-containing protein [Hydrocarboniphaga daqingensis]|uniref:DUF4113 domain-containing protein n=1 Tax=Hydrocarboniphaga daqingensis TaxID=490188 RepID=UPI000A06865A